MKWTVVFTHAYPAAAHFSRACSVITHFHFQNPQHKYKLFHHNHSYLIYHQTNKQMDEHEHEHEEDKCGGVDEPVLIIVNPCNRRALRISRSTHVVRVHKAFRRNGKCWKSGQKVKILKGNSNNNLYYYATLEYFFLEGFLGDASGDAGIICRTIDVSENDGCLLESVEENPKFDLRKSISVPINIIDSGKCLAVDDCEWNDQCQKRPSLIEVLNTTQCHELGIESLLPDETEIYANDVSLSSSEIVAVVRPTTYKSVMKDLDQKYVMKDKFEMLLVIAYSTNKRPHDRKKIYAGRVEPSSLRDFHGLYVFKPSCTSHPLFQKAGVYTFTFSIRDSSCEKHVVKVKVKASHDVHTLTHAKKNSRHNLTSPQHRTPEMARVREPDIKSCLEFEKDLWNEILEIGSRIGELEQEIKKLEAEIKTIEVNLSECEEIRGQILGSLGKDKIMAYVESKSDCAGSLVMKHLNAMQDQDRHGLMANIIGIVALMGTTPTFELSRLFAEYLGDQMLAVVCRHYEDVNLFESYDENGKLNPNFALHMFARELGQSINDRYLVLCLEEIRACETDKDVEGKLLFPNPMLHDGSTPAGFLGYAVNMINIEDDHLDTKTASGCGLRETLFYRLFGETQVYETRKDMKRAMPCIKDGAVSMDGGILRGNGAMSLGCLEPDVIFPTEPARNRLSENDMRVMKRCRELKLELKETIRVMVGKRKSHESDLERFYERRDLYVRFFVRLSSVGSKKFKSLDSL